MHRNAKRLQTLSFAHPPEPDDEDPDPAVERHFRAVSAALDVKQRYTIH
jgi:hypothetical protein